MFVINCILISRFAKYFEPSIIFIFTKNLLKKFRLVKSSRIVQADSIRDEVDPKLAHSTKYQQRSAEYISGIFRKLSTSIFLTKAGFYKMMSWARSNVNYILISLRSQ